MNSLVPYSSTAWMVKGEQREIPKFRCVDRAWKWMKRYGFARLPADIELVFLKNLEIAVDYAIRINSRLPQIFEDKIATNPQLLFRYMRDAVDGPLVEYEDCLKNSPKILVKYSKEVLKKRLPEHLEICLMGDPYACFEYAWGVLDGRLPEALHNYMFGSNMDSQFTKRYRGGHNEKMSDADEYNPDYVSPAEYFEFIKWQRKNLHRLVRHYSEVYDISPNKTVGEFLYELENGR